MKDLELSGLQNAHLRIARPTNKIDRLSDFYQNAFGFEVLGKFQGHDGFDGIMLGHPQQAFHLEFTQSSEHVAPPVPSMEHLLVFYVPIKGDWDCVIARVESLGHQPVASLNPYWDRCGKTYADPDGYRIVIQNAAWSIQ